MKTARQVLCGLDRLNSARSMLANRRLGLITNHTGINRRLQSSIDILNEQYRLSALIAPEHGIRGSLQAGEEVDGALDPKVGVPLFSVYRKDGKHLTKQALDSFDTLVFDIQDVGLRFYTYLYSLGYALVSCAKAGKKVVILDRVNPLGGEMVQGIVLDPALASFVGDYALPTRYGLTIGEFALYVKDHLRLDLDLEVVKLSGWQRSLYLDDTDIPWPPPSPNCPHLTTALCYMGACILEGTNLSEGRGTALPFEVMGAPFIKGLELARRMQEADLPGLGFTPAYFTPAFSKHQGQLCQGIMMHIRDRRLANPLLAVLLMLEQVMRMYPGELEFLAPGATDPRYFFDKLLGTDAFRLSKLSARELIHAQQPGLDRFMQQSRAYHLY